MSGETAWSKWHAPALDGGPTLLGYPRTTERVSLETWMNAYGRAVADGTVDRKKALQVGLNLSRGWLATLPRP